MLNFKAWLEDTGEVENKDLTNTTSDDKFAYLRSKYMGGTKKNNEKKVDTKKLFGKCNKN